MSTKPQLKKVKQKVIQAADLFCGAGGTSSGFVEAVQSLGYDFDLTAKDRLGLIQPFIVPCNHGKDARAYSIDDPMKTITQVDAWGMGEPFIIPCAYGAKSEKGDERCQSVEDPIGTITGVNNWACVEPFLVKLKNNCDGQSIDEPLGTLTTKDSFALCIPQLGAVIDIRFRMLQPHELTAAMGFPRREQDATDPPPSAVKQCERSEPAEWRWARAFNFASDAIHTQGD